MITRSDKLRAGNYPSRGVSVLLPVHRWLAWARRGPSCCGTGFCLPRSGENRGGTLFWKGSPILQDLLCQPSVIRAVRRFEGFFLLLGCSPARVPLRAWPVPDSYEFPKPRRAINGLWLKSLSGVGCANHDNHLAAALPSLPVGAWAQPPCGLQSLCFLLRSQRGGTGERGRGGSRGRGRLRVCRGRSGLRRWEGELRRWPVTCA